MLTVAGAALFATVAAAQGPAGVLRGLVVTDSSAAVPYAIVQLTPGRSVFTDHNGAFAFAGLAAGTYRVSARQIGFTPLDTTITLGAAIPSLRLWLRRLPLRLAAIEVEGERSCRLSTGAAGGADETLGEMFAQLFENARRFQLLADEYPFVYHMERAASDLGSRDQTIWQALDTIEVHSDARWRYRPGGLLQPGIGPRGRPARVVQVPQLPDLADSAFRARHCFRYGGEVMLNGAPALLLEFRALPSLASPDVDGTAWLDAHTYQVRRIAVHVVPALAIVGVLSIEVTADFREVQPFVLVPRRVFTLTQLASRRGDPLRRQEEEQRLIRVHFTRPLDTAP